MLNVTGMRRWFGQSIGRCQLNNYRRHWFLWVSLLLSVTGVGILWWWVTFKTAAVALATLVLYIAVYTPLKRVSWLSVLFGTLPGALPPVGGFFALLDTINGDIILVFTVVAAWQIPHFFALGYRHRHDYQQAGFNMIPYQDAAKPVLFMACLYISTLVMVAASVGLAALNFNAVAIAIVLVLNIWFLFNAGRVGYRLSDRSAQQLFYASLIYLPLWVAATCLSWL